MIINVLFPLDLRGENINWDKKRNGKITEIIETRLTECIKERVYQDYCGYSSSIAGDLHNSLLFSPSAVDQTPR